MENKLLLNLVLLASGALLYWIPPRRSWRTLLLVGIAILSFVNYVSSWDRTPSRIWRDVQHATLSRIDPYDLTFYYLNTKFFDEIGYYDLYPLLLHTVSEYKISPFPYASDRVLLQNNKGFYWKGYEELLRENDSFAHIRDRFTHERWNEFISDLTYLTTIQREGWKNKRRWTNFFWDHGFNAGPVWVAAAARVCALVPIERIKFLCTLEALLLYATIVFLGVILGADIAAISFIVLWNSFSTEWPTIGVGIGRYDYLILLIASCLFAIKGKNRLAGMSFGIAAAFRYLPVVALPVVALRWYFDKKRGNPTEASGNFLVSCVGTLLIVHLGAMAILPPGTFTDYRHKMKAHSATENLTRGKVGLQLAMSWDGSLDQKQITEERKSIMKVQAPIFMIGATLLSAGVVLAALGMPIAVQVSLFPLITFIWLMPSYHYFVLFVLTIIGTHYMGRTSRFWRSICFALLAGEAIARFARLEWLDAQVTTTSIWCLWYVVVICAVAFEGYKQIRTCTSIS